MKIFLIHAICMLALTGICEVKISVSSEPSLPVRNLIAKEASNLTTWASTSKTKELQIAEDPEIKMPTIYADKEQGTVKNIDSVRFEVGKLYVAACWVKAKEKIIGGSQDYHGLGMTVAFWSADWKQSANIYARRTAIEAGSWQRITSKPTALPEWISHARIYANLAYASGSGYVADLWCGEAFTRLKVKIEGENIIQVKIKNDNGETVFDSKVLSTPITIFDKELKVLTPYAYSIIVTTSDGTVTHVNHPEKK